ncbi:uncharacterized protein LOC112568812 isoform X3 [Pomacea canaliculata]|uniref:uncharacterized protein LOC112568812 isoform X3 n=1 Tax=Pomacea canaliculata TaxID=400727 RepID=UPI000D736F5E|nr:uncharacterized protein LOC112568812 isoform X3 [Pomacea canaliculata]
MNIFLDSFFTVFITLLVAHADFSKTAANECVTLEIAGSRFEDNMAEVNEDGYVHISFVITDNCKPSSEFIRVKVSTRSRDHLTTFCTIVFQENICKISDQSLTCHCIKKEEFMFTSISTKISLADKVLIEWSGNRTSKGEKSVFLFVNGSTTKPNTKKMGASVIISICCSIVLVLVIGVVIVKIRKCRAQGIISLKLRREVHLYEANTHAICSCDPCTSAASHSNTSSSAKLHPPRIQPRQSNGGYLEPASQNRLDKPQEKC